MKKHLDSFWRLQRSRLRGFTIIELLIVISVIGILATIATLSYNGVQERSRNTARITAARDMINILELAHMVAPPSDLSDMSYFCLADSAPQSQANGSYNCGENPLPSRYTFSYSEELIAAMKKVSTPLPSTLPVTSWSHLNSNKIFYSPALIVYDNWHYENGQQITALLEFWLEGSKQSCDLETVKINYPHETWTQGGPGTLIPQDTGYSYTDSRATYCYVPLQLDASSWYL